MVAQKETRKHSGLDSPESKISPYEDISTKQQRFTGERFPSLTLGICDSCHWCYTEFNQKGNVKDCPVCKNKLSQIPMALDEVCIIARDDKQGLTITFDRKLPLR